MHLAEDTILPVPAKVGFLTERMLPGLGMDRLNHALAGGLAARGWPVSVHAAQADRDLVPPGAALRPLPHVRSRRAPGADAWAVEALPALEADRSVRWVLTTPPWYALAPWLANTTILHGGTSPPTGLGWKGAATYLYREASQGLLWFPAATRIVTLSRFLARGLPPMLQAKTHIMPLGWDHYPRASAEEAAAAREPLAKGARHLLLYMGRLNAAYQPYKGLLGLVELASQLPRTRLVCAGFGDAADERALTALGCTVLRNHPSAEMGALVAAADVVVMASEWEGYGLPAAEAQYQGTPVAALDRGALGEVVAAGKSGVLAPDLPALGQAVRALLGDPARRADLGAAGQERGEAHPWSRSVEWFAGLLS